MSIAHIEIHLDDASTEDAKALAECLMEHAEITDFFHGWIESNFPEGCEYNPITYRIYQLRSDD